MIIMTNTIENVTGNTHERDDQYVRPEPHSLMEMGVDELHDLFEHMGSYIKIPRTFDESSINDDDCDDFVIVTRSEIESRMNELRSQNG
jgi:hypothetical protein